MEYRSDLAHFVRQVGKLLGKNRLHAVRESLVGLVMAFDEQSVGPDCDGGPRERQNLMALAGAVAGSDEDGQVAGLCHCGDHREGGGGARKIRAPDFLTRSAMARHCSSVSTAQGPATKATCWPPTTTSPEGVGMRRTVSSSLASRLTSL